MRVVRPTVPSNLLVKTGLMGRCKGVFIRWLIDVRLFNTIVVFSVAITVQKRGNCSLAHTVVHTADMTISAVQPGRVAQSVGHLTRKSGVLGSIPGLATYFRFSFRFSRTAVVSYWRKYVHEVLVNRLGGLSLPRKSVVRLTDRPDMTLDVYRGRKTTKQKKKFSCTKRLRYHQYPFCWLGFRPEISITSLKTQSVWM